MTGALLILAFTVAVGLLLYLLDRRQAKKEAARGISDTPNPDGTLIPTESAHEKSNAVNADAVSEDAAGGNADADGNAEGECCGQHIVCEKESLSPFTDEVDYYDDEELDRFAGRSEDEYTSEEIEEFRDVLETLLPQDLAGWGRSITVRGITLPTPIREEFLMLISDLRK